MIIKSPTISSSYISSSLAAVYRTQPHRSYSFVCIIKPRSSLAELENSRAFFMKQRTTSVNFSYRFQNFLSRLSCVQNLYAQLHHFGGGKRCGVDVPLYTANCGKIMCGFAGASIAMFANICSKLQMWQCAF